MPLGLVSTKASLISHSACSKKLPFFQKALTVDLAHVLIKIARNEGGGICMRQIEYASKRLVPTLAFCSVQKRTYGICTKMHAHISITIMSSINFLRIIIYCRNQLHTSFNTIYSAYVFAFSVQQVVFQEMVSPLWYW